MDIRIIVFGMCFVLISLFLGARFFVPREKKSSLLEGKYAEKILAFQNDPSQKNYDACFEAVKLLPESLGKTEEELKNKLKEDQVFLS